ncbi:hypothetical protein HDU91_007292 [Kappamyces sp. JEL0680]|nr:hypothetical protein HDU91_007292 [Kappamyces sp. JEL0680]
MVLYRHLPIKPHYPFNILYFGSDEFSAQCLSGLLGHRQKLIKHLELVVPASGSRVMQDVAEKHGINFYHAPKNSLSGWKIPNRSVSFDLAVVVSFGYFLPKSLLEQFSYGGINIHPSLLPKYRGSSPIQYTILNRDSVAGVSIIELSPKAFDAGKILDQRKVEIQHPISYLDLQHQLAAKGTSALIDTLEHFELRRSSAQVQDEALVTKAGKIKVEDAMLHWDRLAAVDAYTMFNAFGHKVCVERPTARFPFIRTFEAKRSSSQR